MSNNNPIKQEGNLKSGDYAPDFCLPGMDGKVYCLNDFKEKAKALVVAFWCNHCPHVIKNENRMIKIGKDYQKKGVGFVLISANDVINYPQDGLEKMKKRAKEKRYPFPYLYNEDQTVAHAYGAKVTPHIFVFDSELKLRYRGAIDDNPDLENRETNHYLRDALDTILDEKPEQIIHPETQPKGCSIKWKI